MRPFLSRGRHLYYPRNWHVIHAPSRSTLLGARHNVTPSPIYIRHESQGADAAIGDHKSGHIEAQSNEGILFFNSENHE